MKKFKLNQLLFVIGFFLIGLISCTESISGTEEDFSDFAERTTTRLNFSYAWGNYTYKTGNNNTYMVTFRASTDGVNTEGYFRLIHSSGHQITGTINCLEFCGNEAFLLGTFGKSIQPDGTEVISDIYGMPSYFSVTDNNSFDDSVLDESSFTYNINFGDTEPYCFSYWYHREPIERGNIQIYNTNGITTCEGERIANNVFAKQIEEPK